MDPAASAPPPGATAEGTGPAQSPWGAQRDRERRRVRRRQAAVLLVAYVALVGLITLTPDSVDRGVYPYLMRGVLFVQHHGIPGFRYSMIEEVANVALFAPLGMLGVLALGAPRWWLVVLAGTAMSASVELAQGAFLPARVASVTDVAANGAGALLGATTAGIVAARTRRRGRIRS
ncbi:VanZ family protein [Clavibacter michiganensis]|uniref:Antibiotic resistance protein VanZ n=2 Tax=Clavibacter michiganensis subsp. insidiosus TaxID=33014 RepID=A0A0D5CKD1_9MICO|nr:VanZ family protein [Clavibacter michiganensis]AJW79702.1 antibiotic resistance protein VanZ [Clavibacter michiganensis subsp. insidiosus]AWF99082.1 antibiotic resistance protein VanZ [Clavibacter michiganensis subsp. insidiosus]AWG00684.1 antibiotic resistance protein VanZ [Clavibacter michiganensis subsp. insidiosus]OQJ60710.1 VanZ family protein [Clavibacter michiganensis subsp. insidiosus]RII85876.1 VanZ family protein [Clavibacter michiganensis subsp. insidiosus]